MGTCRILSRGSDAFRDRAEAAEMLARELSLFADRRPVVLGIPRGGVVVARVLAKELGGDLDIVLSHKLGAPHNPELAIGSVSEDGKVFLDERLAAFTGAGTRYIDREKARQLDLIAERVERYRKVRPKVPLEGRVAIVADDGVATGATMKAALWSARLEKPATLVAAIPVGPEETVAELANLADEVVCLEAPPGFAAVGEFYRLFEQVDDEEVVAMLKNEFARQGGR